MDLPPFFRLSLDATTGTTKDYVYGQLKVPYTYVLELRDKGWHGFLLPAIAIIPTAKETFGAIQAMVEAMDLSYVSRMWNLIILTIYNKYM